MQDTRRKIGSKMHRKKLMNNWELKRVLPYTMKKVLPYFILSFYHKKKTTKAFFFSSHTPSFSSLSIIFVFVF